MSAREIHIVETTTVDLDIVIARKETSRALCGDSFVIEHRPTLDRPICILCVATYNRDYDRLHQPWTPTVFRKDKS